MVTAQESHPSNEIVLSRTFRAPRRLVFEAWTRAEAFARWFGPHGVKLVVIELDARPSGILHFRHEFPDGQSLWVRGTFHEVVPDERLTFSSGFVDAVGQPGRHPMFPDWPLEAIVETAVTFDDADSGTTVTLRQKVLPAQLALREPVLTERKLARQGWDEVLERLEEFVAGHPRAGT